MITRYCSYGGPIASWIDFDNAEYRENERSMERGTNGWPPIGSARDIGVSLDTGGKASLSFLFGIGPVMLCISGVLLHAV